jgi:hypothetical protein
VLTAAHCLADKNGTINRQVITTPDGVKIYDVDVEVGKTDLSDPNQGHTYMVREGDIFIHPVYGTGAALGSTRVYDVAVVKLYATGRTARPPKGHGLPPQPIKLATAAQDYMEEPGR